MARIKIKICGLFRAEDVEYVNAALPDYAGFVFAERSRRYVTPARARALRAGLDSRIVPVGVFADTDAALIASLAEDGVVGAVQLHGRENEAFVREVKARVRVPVIKAIVMCAPDGTPKPPAAVLREAESAADFLLFDSGAGTGEVFDWRAIPDMGKAFFLAGGLSVYNIKEAIASYAPYAADISSGAETDGVKDREKILELVRAVRESDGLISDR
ncbi:MAG: phosphoribosylanthranilate isomerase [Clostridiales Family XIII bacterium]|jgi:phosphoribosylanthranilate isomerase|nr:phosphoribosylanthranilate isomerase [Clostridiales Family XIII bacterium]